MARGEFSLSEICGRRLLSAAVAIFVVRRSGKRANGHRAATPSERSWHIRRWRRRRAYSTDARVPRRTVHDACASSARRRAPAVPGAAPAEPAREVRFSCDLAPDAESCREAGAPDGGGDDSECSCARDVCYDHLDPSTGQSHRVCEKAK